MFKLSDYAYHLPEERIAQTPCGNRSESRLLHINRASGRIAHHRFKDLVTLLRDDDLLVINTTKVIPARLFGKKETGGSVEVLILDFASGMKHLEKEGCFRCDCLVRASRSPKEGACILFEGGARARVEKRKGTISELIFLNCPDMVGFLNDQGRVPLPPYIRRDANQTLPEDKADYQTVYAEDEGAVAAPTAGLHFSESLMQALREKGIAFAPVTLHVGYGTFVPVKVADIRDHQIHSEYFSLSRRSADMINTARTRNRRIIAVGTTSVRTLEYVADEHGMVRETGGMCDLFIYPGYRFKCVDAMITNFHLPESTLLMLVSAFYEREKMLAAYQTAVEQGYRFFSYGDAMLIE